MKDTILKLLKSTTVEDVEIAIHLMAKYSDTRELFREYGKNLTPYTNDSKGKQGPRYEIPLKISNFHGYEIKYFKLKQGYYLVISKEDGIVECYKPYDKSVKIVEL